MPAQRDEPSAPPQAENDLCQRIVVALRATGRLVPAFRRGMSLPYGVRAVLLPWRAYFLRKKCFVRLLFRAGLGIIGV